MQRTVKHLTISVLVLAGLVAAVYRKPAVPQLPNRIPEAAPYDTLEARFFPPPYEESWETVDNPGRCATCHSQIFAEWNGSMMANSWRDPAWRGAFLLSARMTATDGDCDIPEPPDGTERARLNPFAGEGCTSRFDMGTGEQTLSHSGSLMDPFCSRCHMPANYTDNIPLQNVVTDPGTGEEHGILDPGFDPTSDAGTGLAFATLDEQLRNTEAGKRGIFCAVCHTMTETRETPFHNYPMQGKEYEPALGKAPRSELLPAEAQQPRTPPAPDEAYLGYGIGAGSFRLSPHAIVLGETFGPLASAGTPEDVDPYTSGVFGVELHHEAGRFTKHPGFQHVKYQRAEMCASCHDVTNRLTIKNRLGHWVGGFPIERTYTEWLGSRYADRPGNDHFDPAYKRDCQTCHMQQDYGQPGTAQTLYRNGKPVPPRTGRPADGGPERSVLYSHHFIGGNSYVTRLIGRDVSEVGDVEDYPELSTFSFSSADPKSPYHNAFWVNTGAGGAPSQHARLAWDRLRNVLELDLSSPAQVTAGTRAPLSLAVTNTGSGHNFPSGFPEGRNAWVAVRAFDLATGRELDIYDSHWKRTSKGVGSLIDHDMVDPNFPGCDWQLPAGSPDPYAYQMKAVASLGDGCPTLDLVYASPLNLVTDDRGLPVDAEGRVIGRDNPEGLPRFRDLDGDGDVYDDAFLMDTRLRPLPDDAATARLDRYSVVIPAGTRGPVAVVAAVYYQSIEGIVAKKFLGNLADTDLDGVLEPCALGGACDGRRPTTEPAVVEGAPAVPMEVTSRVIDIAGTADRTPPAVVATYPADAARDVYDDPVVKVTFSEPVTGVDASSFTLESADGEEVPAFVDQIADGTWGLFPHRIFLEPGASYTAHLAAGICDFAGNCLRRGRRWSFRVTETPGGGRGVTAVPLGFPGYLPPPPDPSPAVAGVETLADGAVRIRFTEPVLNVTPLTLRVSRDGGAAGGCAEGVTEQLAGSITSDAEGTSWTFRPAAPEPGRPACVTVTSGVYDLQGQRLATPFVGRAEAASSAPLGESR